MTDALHRVVDALLKLLGNLPGADEYVYERIGLSALLVLLAVFGLFKSSRDGNVLMRAAIRDLRNRIRSRVDQPALMTASALRGLAKSIQVSLKSPAFTDAAIAEAIRLVALDVEDMVRGAKLVRAMETLDKAVRELDPEAGGLLSIAAIDRLLAYLLSTLATLGMLLFLQLLFEASVAWFDSKGFIVHPDSSGFVLWLFPIAYLWLAFSSLRASLYWKAALPSNDARFAISDMLKPRSLHAISDFFLLQAQSSDDDYLHQRWAASWEVPFITFSPRRFVDWHSYKYFERSALDLKLARMNDEINRIRQAGDRFRVNIAKDISMSADDSGL